MNTMEIINRTYTFIMNRLVETGRAPHFSEIAASLGLSMTAGRQALHDLIKSGVYGWLYPGTDILVSLAPFSSLPNQFRVTIDGRQKWFAQ